MERHVGKLDHQTFHRRWEYERFVKRLAEPADVSGAAGKWPYPELVISLYADGPFHISCPRDVVKVISSVTQIQLGVRSSLQQFETRSAANRYVLFKSANIIVRTWFQSRILFARVGSITSTETGSFGCRQVCTPALPSAPSTIRMVAFSYFVRPPLKIRRIT